MKFIISCIFFTTSMSAFAFPMMNTKERVRMELWFEGVDLPSTKVRVQDKKIDITLPVELEQALLKF